MLALMCFKFIKSSFPKLCAQNIVSTFKSAEIYLDKLTTFSSNSCLFETAQSIAFTHLTKYFVDHIFLIILKLLLQTLIAYE